MDRNTQRYLRHTLQQILKGRYGKSASIVAIIALVIFSFFIPFDLFDDANITDGVAKKGDLFHHCKVTKLTDGDSIHARCPFKNDIAEKEEKIDLVIRIYGIDAPEMKQVPWGERAKQYLHSQLNYNNLTVEIKDIDRYQRHVAKIYNGDQDLGLLLVQKGHAVVYERYNDDPRYKELEAEAKKAKIGIWSKSGSHQHPEKWRRTH